MDGETLDRMVSEYELSRYRYISGGIDYKSGKRNAIMSSLRAMWIPVEHAPVNQCGILMRVRKSGAPWFCMGLIEPDGTARMADYASVYSECDFEPTHFAPLLPGPEE